MAALIDIAQPIAGVSVGRLPAPSGSAEHSRQQQHQQDHDHEHQRQGALRRRPTFQRLR